MPAPVRRVSHRAVFGTAPTGYWPADGDGSAADTAAAAVAFVSLGAWTLRAWRSATDPWPVRPAVSATTAGVVLVGLVGWFFGELAADTGRVGISERGSRRWRQ
jgi:hypothetical protein